MDATPIIIKKKKSHGHAHHGGSWKVAYADFVTAMMAFFMVMWIMGLSDETKAQIQGYFNDPMGFMKNPPRSRTVIPIKSVASAKPGQSSAHETEPYADDQQAMKQLKKDIDTALEASPELRKLAEHIDIQITEEGLRIEFLDNKDDFFESGQSVLKPGAMRMIQTLGPLIAASGRPIGIEGHTDSVPFAGDPVRNFTLSTERANALAVALGHMKVPINKFKYVKGLADRELRDPKHPASAINRRVTLLLPFVASLEAQVPMPKDAVRHQMSQSIVPNINVGPQKPNVLKQR